MLELWVGWNVPWPWMPGRGSAEGCLAWAPPTPDDTGWNVMHTGTWGPVEPQTCSQGVCGLGTLLFLSYTIPEFCNSKFRVIPDPLSGLLHAARDFTFSLLLSICKSSEDETGRNKERWSIKMKPQNYSGMLK